MERLPCANCDASSTPVLPEVWLDHRQLSDAFFLYSGLLLALPRELRLLAGGTGTFSDIPTAVLYVGVSDRQNSYEQFGRCHFLSLLLLCTLLRKSVVLCGSR